MFTIRLSKFSSPRLPARPCAAFPPQLAHSSGPAAHCCRGTGLQRRRLGGAAGPLCRRTPPRLCRCRGPGMFAAAAARVQRAPGPARPLAVLPISPECRSMLQATAGRRGGPAAAAHCCAALDR
jgi:hypothetical protein